MSVHVLHRGREESRPEWTGAIASEMEEVEQELRLRIETGVPAATELAAHLLSAGGKRLRPALVILSALACGSEVDRQGMVSVATAMEMMHMASLVHDDVIDETHERRGVSTANARWGNKVSVLGGDVLLARTFRLLAFEADAEVTRVISGAAVTMTESEVLQAAGGGSISFWESNYWHVIRDKTAVLMGACCECGAILAGAEPRVRSTLADYGLQLGLAFQVMDDVLDIAGDPALTGKEVGTDLAHGKFTLPVILALRDADASERHALLSALNRESLSREDVLGLADLLIESGAVQSARESALACASEARLRIAELPPSEYSDALASLTDFVVEREM